MTRRRLRKAKYRTAQTAKVHDLTAQTTLPHNAKIFVDEIDAAYGDAEFAAYDAKRGELVSSGQPRDKVVRSIRNDPLGALYAQGIVDRVQWTAGEIWRWSYVNSEIGSLRAIDPTREGVDGGSLNDPSFEQVKRAVENLRKARWVLGLPGESLVTDVIGKGLTLSKAADARGYTSKSGREYIGKRFRECLDSLAEVFGCATPQNAVRRQTIHTRI